MAVGRYAYSIWCLGALVLGNLVLAGCGHYHYAGPLRPAAEQTERLEAAKGRVVFTQGPLRVEVQPLTDAQLNRQFGAHSDAGPRQTNPYTFGDTEFWEGEKERRRFTTFRIGVTNDGLPKVKIDPSRIVLRVGGGAEYWSLDLQQLDTYYRAYAIGFRGNEYARYQERLDILRRSMYRNEEVFVGQQAEGYIVFPAIAHDVRDVELVIHDAVLRFDHRNEPVETVQIVCRFQRDVGKIYPDGRLVIDDAG